MSQLRDVRYITALFSLNKRDFNKWRQVSWQYRIDYINNVHKIVYPCMQVGDFWYKGIKYHCENDKLEVVAQ